MNTETKEMESNLALSWYEKIYTQSQAEWSAEQQGLNFENVTAGIINSFAPPRWWGVTARHNW